MRYLRGMSILNISVAETSRVEDIFGTFVNRVRNLVEFLFCLMSQAIHELEAWIFQTIGRAPPVFFAIQRSKLIGSVL